MMPFSQDYKRLNDFDQGPNTGGMGAICPYLHLKERETEFIKQGIMQKVIDGLKSRGIIYKGVLYAGLMFTEEGMKVLEFNCRFGDPECEVVLPLLRTDLYDICYNCAKGSLRSVEISWATNEFACATMMISKGYPGHYEIGYPIVGMHISAMTKIVTINDLFLTPSTTCLIFDLF
ncbi:unnamed protein product [Soboliphyme baturini]|uniref:ATP-grasp domain-containing protein n=1 Tax=Soboliphyme baturini TaxID=241478 RepID=A0A183J9S9_9BILA|nr:unnamed protein product [Soboliphyme baturini]